MKELSKEYRCHPFSPTRAFLQNPKLLLQQPAVSFHLLRSLELQCVHKSFYDAAFLRFLVVNQIMRSLEWRSILQMDLVPQSFHAASQRRSPYVVKYVIDE